VCQACVQQQDEISSLYGARILGPSGMVFKYREKELNDEINGKDVAPLLW